MSELTYNDISNEIIEWGNYDVDSSALNVRSIINRATRYVGNWQQGRWNGLYIRDYSTTVDSTGYLVSLPSDLNVLYRVHQSTLERYQYRRYLDYDLQVEQPTDLADEPTRKIKFYYALQANETIYLSYWRNIKEFADSTDQVPDLPQSGEAILETAKWFVLRNERGVNLNEKSEQRLMAEDMIRQLWAKDNGFDIDESAPPADMDLDNHFAGTNYDLSDGGDAVKFRGPIMDRNFGG